MFAVTLTNLRAPPIREAELPVAITDVNRTSQKSANNAPPECVATLPDREMSAKSTFGWPVGVTAMDRNANAPPLFCLTRVYRRIRIDNNSEGVGGIHETSK